ncbi:MAG: hypothetical protein JW699_06205 [Chitinispirillaceae bacterium]|nr:hypothetical protein [Chitinispirillaceae bacterium]
MNQTSIAVTPVDGPGQKLPSLTIAGSCFTGWALAPHLDTLPSRSGMSITRRSALAETMYRYRYQNDGLLLHPIAARFASTVRTLFPAAPPMGFDGLVMVPPPLDRADYGPVVALVTEISRLTGIPTLQFAVRDVQASGHEPSGRSDRAFGFSSSVAAMVFAGKRVLVIDDIFRSGRSLNRFCSLIRNEGGASQVMAIVGTVVKRVSGVSPNSTS